MAQRNPLNERYTKDDKKGKTRKSAASAKPAKRAADSVRVQSDSKEKEGLFKKRSPEQKSQDKKKRLESNKKRDIALTAGSILMERDPVYVKYRRVWWIVLIIAIVATLISWAIQFWFNTAPVQFIVGVLAIAYIAIIGSLVIDLWKVRPIRNKYREQAASMSEKAQRKLIYERQQEIEAKKNAKKKNDSSDGSAEKEQSDNEES